MVPRSAQARSECASFLQPSVSKETNAVQLRRGNAATAFPVKQALSLKGGLFRTSVSQY